MNRYDIALKKPPPPPKPTPKKEESTKHSSIDKQSIVREYMSTADGRQRLATAMLEPFRQRLNLRSFARRLFNVDPLPVGAIPLYAKDAGATAYVIGEEGQNVMAFSQPSRVIIPFFEIRSVPRISLTRLRDEVRGQPNVVEETIGHALQDFVREEEDRVIDILDATTRTGTNVININSMSDFATSTLVDAFTIIEDQELRVANILMSNRDYSRLVLTRDILDINTHREMLENGLVGTVYGAQINVSSNVPVGRIYFLPEPQHAGILPERYFECLSVDDPVARQIGFSFMENIGLGCLDSRRIAKVLIHQ